MVLDELLDNKIGMGKYQYINIFFLALVELNDGAQIILISLSSPVLEKEWDLTQAQVSSLTSVFYFGTFAGAILTGKMADKFGRRPMVLIGSLSQIIVLSFFFWINSYLLMIIIKGLYGFSYGLLLALTTSYFAQITPQQFRGKGILLLNFFATIGKFYGLLLASVFLDNFYEGNWRGMMVFGCLPNIIVFVGALIYMKETPRFLVGAKKFQEAFKILQFMCNENHSFPDNVPFALSESEKNGIIQYQREIFEGKQRAVFCSLFNRYYIGTTICLCMGWFCTTFIYYGQLTSLPYVLGKTEKSIGSYALAIVGELPCIVVSILIIDRQGFGRTKSLLYAFLLSAIFHGIFVFLPLTIISMIVRFFMKMCFQMLYPCTTQCYGTQNRAMGFGLDSSIGRLGATLMPYIVIPVSQNNPKYASVIFVLFSLIGAIFALFIPKEPMNRPLDEKLQIQLDTYKAITD